MIDFDTFTKALKSCPKSNKTPNLVTLIFSNIALPNFEVLLILYYTYEPKSNWMKNSI